jgi:MoxR-like ATPase
VKGKFMVQDYEKLQDLVENASKVIVGKKESIKLLVATWLAGGHALIEDVPGTGKTVLAKTLSALIKAPMGRVQFTPDLLPGDITGTTIYDQNTHQFKFEKGPIFCSFFLADEINRATPRTQSALLEAMSEKQITSDRETHALDKAFFVVATQNPIEHHGTFPLPEAQLDRFSIRMSLGYMSAKEELQMVKGHINESPLNSLKPIMERSNFLAFRAHLKNIKIQDSVFEYAVNIVDKTRKSKELSVGCSPRATLTLLQLARAISFMNGEDFVRPQIIYQLVPYVLGHRIILSQDSKFAGLTEAEYLTNLLARVQPPTK